MGRDGQRVGAGESAYQSARAECRLSLTHKPRATRAFSAQNRIAETRTKPHAPESLNSDTPAAPTCGICRSRAPDILCVHRLRRAHPATTRRGDESLTFVERPSRLCVSVNL